VAAGVTLRQALDEAARRLQLAGIERPRAEARLLAGHALGLTIEQVVGSDTNILSGDQAFAIERLVQLRESRQPMAQVLGYREFYGRRFAVTADVLTPRPDSETLIDAVLRRVPERSSPLEILELGVGSGCLLLSLLAELPRARGTGIEISPKALAVAGGNAEALRLADRVTLQAGDWSAAANGPFDVIVSNPPYIPHAEIAALEPEVARYEPALALDGGKDGLDYYRRLAVDLDRLLAPGGFVVLEIGFGQADDVAAILAASGFGAIERHRDLGGIERCLQAARP